MNVEDLITQDNPKCLYCNSNLNTREDTSTTNTPPFYIVTILTCTSCNEIFEIHAESEDLILENLVVISTLFSCKELNIRTFIELKICYLGQDIRWPGGVWLSGSSTSKVSVVPIFEVDFSDKDKLYQKLKTYLLFS